MSPATYSVTTSHHTYHIDEASGVLAAQAIFDGDKMVDVRTAADSMFDGKPLALTLVVAHIEAITRHDAGCDDLPDEVAVDPTEVQMQPSNVIQIGRKPVGQSL
jgi:hypothetical protein